MTTRKRTLWTTALLVAFGVGVTALAAPAHADRGDRHSQHDKHKRHDRKRDDDRDFFVHIELGKRPAPVYRTVTERVWVKETWHVVHEKVWVPPVTRIVHERVWVEDDCDPRLSVAIGGRNFKFVLNEGGRRSGHWEVREREVIVQPGYYRTVERRVCTPGHWETVTRQVRIDNGRW